MARQDRSRSDSARQPAGREPQATPGAAADRTAAQGRRRSVENFVDIVRSV